MFFKQHECLIGKPNAISAYPGTYLEANEASLALLCGAKPKVISEALGHSSVAFTMDTYSHIISGMPEDMMALLDEVIPAGVGKKLDKEALSWPG